MKQNNSYDVIIIGGGHAGTEAASAAARAGSKVLLITQKLSAIGEMSCNPAIGGIGKGHLTKEIDALGGIMARAIDQAGIHFRVLNASKGPAVRATRAQADRTLYKAAVVALLKKEKNLSFLEETVDSLIIEKDIITGVETKKSGNFIAKSVVLTTGTFLAGKILFGDHSEEGGRIGDRPSNNLANNIRALSFKVGRLKTGTPPRLDKNSLDYKKMEKQPGDDPRPVFSFMGTRAEHPEQLNCFITKTTKKTHQIISDALHTSPIYSGVIESVGPRYCPSIEDKIVRFANKESHQIFVEPEGIESNVIYPNGISTSLPREVQTEFVRSIIGFENAEITQFGYAIEYDFVDPRELRSSLETVKVSGLFFAGQINGTTGYEEAAAQGLIAGINAHRYSLSLDEWVPARQNSYMGVLVDDLTSRGVSEPYRMFTSRAEYRLLLREDNADQRMTPLGRELGLIDDHRWDIFSKKMDVVRKEQLRLESIFLSKEKLTSDDKKILGREYKKETDAATLLKRPEYNYDLVTSLSAVGPIDWKPYDFSNEQKEQIKSQLETRAKYSGYIKRQEREILKLEKNESLMLPRDIDYSRVHGLSNEAIQKLQEALPQSLGQASRIEGITPATLSLLLLYLKKNNKKIA